MHRLLSAVIVVILTAGANAENWARWFDESCKVAGYVDVGGLREVPMIAELMTGEDKISRFIGSVRDWTSVDLDTVTDAWFGIAGKNDALFVLEGDFNVSVIRGRVSGFEKFQIVTPAGAEFAVLMPDDKHPGKTNLAAFLTPHVLVMGQRPRVEAFLANRESGQRHPRHADLASLATTTHILECAILEIPNEKQDMPPVIRQNVRLIHLIGDADENADLTLAVHPVDQAMISPLRKLVEGFLELYACVPGDQLPLGKIKKALLDHASVDNTTEAVTASTSLPLELLRDVLAARFAARPAAVQE